MKKKPETTTRELSELFHVERKIMKYFTGRTSFDEDKLSIGYLRANYRTMSIPIKYITEFRPF